MTNIQMNESASYEYAFNNIARKSEQNKEAIEAFKAESKGVTMKEAMTSDELVQYIPAFFDSEITLLGQRAATARNSFSTIMQSSHPDFKIRFKEKNEGAQILRELDNIQFSKSERFTEEFGFNKILDASLMSWELLADSVIDEAGDEVRMAASKIYRRENQLWSDQAIRFSQGTKNDTWGNWVEGPSCNDSSANPENDDELAAQYLDAMETAYLDVTTRLTDAQPQSSLKWFLSPQVFSILWKDENIRRFDALGSTPAQVTGVRPMLFGIPHEIVEIGYFDASSNWVPQPCDLFLCSSESFRLRERVSLRTSPLTLDQIQASGVVLWERLCFYPKNPLAYRRISPNEDIGSQIANSANIKIITKSDI